MNKRNRSGVMALVAVMVAAAFASPAALAEEERFTLPGAVPEDVFFCMAERHNPERDFLDQYWGEVWETLKASGIGSDLMALISMGLEEDQQAEIDRLKERASQLLAGVDWGQLDAKEFAFAERMPVLRRLGGDINVAVPDMVWLFRGTAEGAGKNFEGLAAILEAIAEEVNKASGEEMLILERTEKMGATVAGLRVPWAPFTLDVARRGDVIAIAFGETILDETLGLLTGKGSKKPITADPRFAAAFKELPPAEDLMVFFDMRRLLDDIRGIAATAIDLATAHQEPAVTNAYQNPEAVALNRQAVEAYGSRDHAKALELITKAHEVDPTDSVIMYDLACFHALGGHKEEALGWLEKAVSGGFNDPKLISKDSDLNTLRDDPRYEAALAKATAAVADNQGDKVAMIQRVVKRLLDVPGIVDHVAVTEHTEGYATHAEWMVALAPDAAAKPFYGVVGKRKPLSNFDRYLPEETVSFSLGSGIDFAALYKFIEDSFHEAGPAGQGMWARWVEVQKEADLNVVDDVIGWMDGQTVSVTMGRGMAANWVGMFKVSDETRAREKVAAAIESLAMLIKEGASAAPMLAMYTPRTAPVEHPKLEGFQSLFVGMQPKPLVWGAAQGYLIVGTDADAVALCLSTAAGEHPNIRSNAQVMSEALLPQGPFSSITFTDKREFGQKLSVGLGMTSMFGMFIPMAIPDPDVQKVVSKIVGIVGKLAPVAAKIDFYKSATSYSTFDGQAWHIHKATNYQSPTERAPAASQ